MNGSQIIKNLVWPVLFCMVASLVVWQSYIGSGAWQEELNAKLDKAAGLSRREMSWVNLQISGRDVTILGEAPDRETLQKTIAVIAETAGVRKVVNSAKIRVWSELIAPTVDALETRDRSPRISGTWPTDAAVGLSVELDGRFYVLDEAEELQIEGGTWTLDVPIELADGSYDVEVTAWRGNSSSVDTGSADLRIDTIPPTAPVVDRISTNLALPKIGGSWPSDDAVRLEIQVLDRVYQVGADPELDVSVPGRWTLSLSEPVPDGATDVVARAYDKVGNSAADVTKDELVVDVTPPAAPTVNTYESSRTFTLSGTWAEGDAVKLEIEVAGTLYILGKDKELTSDGSGSWFFLPSRLPGEGVYDIVARSTDLAGNQSTDQSQDELVIKFQSGEPEPGVLEEAPRALTGFECQRKFNAHLAQSAVSFKTGTSQLERGGVFTVDALAGIASRCPGARIEIGVHTDSQGEFSQNRRLSDARARTVLLQFVRRGINRDRLTSVGYGELRPIASNRTEAGRSANRRVELFVKH